MSNNKIKSCQCFRFPSGTAMCASERTKQKADIQICINDALLNCNTAVPQENITRRIYSGTQNRLRSINGCKLEDKSMANANCGGNANCIFSDKKAADFWIMENSS